MTQRQQVLHLWMDGAGLDDKVIAWAFHDGTAGAGPTPPGGPAHVEPPYATGVSALEDGWMLMQAAQLIPPAPGHEHTNSYLEYEFVFERRVDMA